MTDAGIIGAVGGGRRSAALLLAASGFWACSASGTEPVAPSSHDAPVATSEMSPAIAEPSTSASPAAPSATAEPSPGGAGPTAGTAAPVTGEGSTAATRCTDRPDQEAPVHEGKMGQGDRLIRIFNRTGVPVRLRLLDESDKPVLEGTLHLPKAGEGELRVATGSYRVRYRLETSCEVLRGSPIVLTGNRAGVEIQLRSGGSGPGSGSVQHVGGAL